MVKLQYLGTIAATINHTKDEKGFHPGGKFTVNHTQSLKKIKK